MSRGCKLRIITNNIANVVMHMRAITLNISYLLKKLGEELEILK